jgi:hypothetical protein
MRETDELTPERVESHSEAAPQAKDRLTTVLENQTLLATFDCVTAIDLNPRRGRKFIEQPPRISNLWISEAQKHPPSKARIDRHNKNHVDHLINVV